MAKLTINRGSVANDGTGDNLRDGANKVNLNFIPIYYTTLIRFMENISGNKMCKDVNIGWRKLPLKPLGPDKKS